jgi:hypothetical protein
LENRAEPNGVATIRVSRLNPETEEDPSSFAYKTIMGYSGVWNLQKPHIRAFGAGSIFFLKVSGAGKLPRSFYLGEKQNEGFGVCELMRVSEMPDVNEKSKAAFGYCQAEGSDYRRLSEYQRILENYKTLNDLKAKAYGSSSRQSLDITSSLLGRVMLMLDQAKDWEDFRERIRSIRDDGARKKINKFIVSIIGLEEISEQNSNVDWAERLDELREVPPECAGSDWKAFWNIVFRIQRYKLKLQEVSLAPTALSAEEGS